MYFHNPEEREARELRPGIIGRTFWGEEMLMAVVDLDANSILPAHSHPHEQVGIILQGEVTFIIAGEKKLMKTGEIYIVPSGVEHEVHVGDEPARVLDVFHPVRDDLKY